MDAEFPSRDVEPGAERVFAPLSSLEDGPEYHPFEPLAALPPPRLTQPPAPPPPVLAPPGPLARVLAGLESGVVGAALMIVCFAAYCFLERQYWWAMMNLWGAGVYHNQVFAMGLGRATLVGAAVHFFLHGVGGAVWSLSAARITNVRLYMAGSFAAAGLWYLVLMYAFWPVVAPVVSRITPLPATLVAYLIFGVALSRTARRARAFSAFSEI